MSSAERDDTSRHDDDTLLVESFPDPLDAFAWLAGASHADAETRLKRLKEEEEVVGREPVLLVLDTETDGGKGQQLAVQLAFVVIDAKGREVCAKETLLRLPTDRKVNYHARKVHGISDERLRKHGVDARAPLEEMLGWFARVRAAKGRVVAHNAAFDRSVVLATCRQNGVSTRDIQLVQTTVWFCTMQGSREHAGCVDVRGRRRAPKNSELYTLLHGEAPVWARLHESALDDCRVTLGSYNAGKRRGWWR